MNYNMRINVYYWNNGVGVVNHSRLMKSLLHEYDVVEYDISIKNEYRKGDLGIFIQNILPDQFENNKKNVYIVCEEWLTEFELKFINEFDSVFVHSNYAKKLLVSYHRNVFNIGFFSLDRYFFPKNTKKILHFKGKSIQKNYELVYNFKDVINIIDSEQNYLNENEVIQNLNSHDIHICCSLYESWGHYLWEALSCGKLVICSEIPVFKEYLDCNLVKFVSTDKIVKFDSINRFLNKTDYPFRTGYFVNNIEFKKYIDNREELFQFQQKNKENIRNYFLDVTNKNKNIFLKTIKCLI